MEEYKTSFVFVPPSFGKKNQLATLNNISKWWKFAQTKMKHKFKTDLSEWSIPIWNDNPFTKAEIEYTILRKDGKKIDSDNLAFPYKWLQDLLVENGYLVDDDKIKVVLNPTELYVSGSIETSVKVKITLKERYTMTIEELKTKVKLLEEDLSKVCGENHVKSSSARVRKILGEIKNATPQLRRDLVKIDKSV